MVKDLNINELLILTKKEVFMSETGLKWWGWLILIWIALLFGFALSYIFGSTAWFIIGGILVIVALSDYYRNKNYYPAKLTCTNCGYKRNLLMRRGETVGKQVCPNCNMKKLQTTK